MDWLILFNLFFAIYNFVFWGIFRNKLSLVCGLLSLTVTLVLILALYH